ncbi:hypothetical protein [Nocardiopsis sp. JB363]|uniref:hypothetical protein n=1 Tax=Nocardiopsis sp. JB363 TaxID=1434837 RepID=UPI00097B895B|nr:hypothetical protein [Nocardiopsis sp. JB363]SIO85536.1 hypothetical protein BQ8420_07445 [Nocardiopsis sp. JB363]
MQHPIGRHHRRCRSLTEHLWALFALTLAAALAYVFIPKKRVQAAIAPAPKRAELPTPEPSLPDEDDHRHPDEYAGALVRPYLTPLIPRPRVPVGTYWPNPNRPPRPKTTLPT